MPTATRNESAAQLADRAYHDRCPADFDCFVRGLVIKGQHGPAMFDLVMAGFQRDWFADVTPSLLALRDGEMPPVRRFWNERTKKAGKDSDLAVCVLWLVAFAVRPFYGQIGAADKGQAAIIRERISDLLHYNPWLREHVKLVKWEISSKNGLAKVDIMASDIAGAHGGTPDLLIINELSHVTKWGFVENLMSNAAGVARGVVIIATNAGFRGTMAEVWRQNAIRSDDWLVHVWKRPAPWHTKENIADEKKMSGRAGRFDRLWYGKWQSGKGDALDEHDLDHAFGRYIKALDGREDGWRYVAGLDLGVSHDHSGLVVLGVNVEEQLIKTARWWAWEPPEGGEVDLMDVEETVVKAFAMFGVEWLWYDPSQAKLMVQRLSNRRLNVREMSFSSPKNLTLMAESLVQVVEAHKLHCYDDDTGRLRRDLGKFSIVEKLPSGYKLEAVSDEFGHADVGTALVVCLPAAVDMMRGVTGLHPDDDLAWDDDSPLTDEEYEEMDEGLRDIYDAG